MVADLEELVLSPLLWVLLFLGSYGLFLHDIQQRVRSPFGHVSLVEIPGPEESPSFLNEYLSAMDDILFEFWATIDKFIGDAMMSLLGTPKAMEKSAKSNR